MMRLVLFPSNTPRRRGGACLATIAVACAFTSSIARSQTGSGKPLLPGISSHVEAELVADVASVQPGMPFRLGVRLKMAEGWHVNWINPGDAGLAPSIAWKLPEGFKAGVLAWPLPSRFVTAPLMIFGYAGDVLLMTDVRVPANVPVGVNIDLGADISWLECAGECIPGSATLHLQLPVEAKTRTNPDERKKFDETAARLPGHTVAWNVDAYVEESNTLVLEIQSGSGQSGSGESAPLEDAYFFPYDPGLIENAAPQILSKETGGGAGQSVYQLRIARARMPVGELRQVYGLLVAASGLSTGAGPAAIEVNVPVTRR